MSKQANIITTIIVFAIILFLSYLPINLGLLDPIGNALKDFEIFDIVFSRLRVEQNLDSNIVIVNIGNLDRIGIANQIHKLSKYGPKVIGVDVFFREPWDKNQDSILTNLITSSKNLIIVNKLTNYNDDKGIYESELKSFYKLGEASVGYANLSEDIGGGYKTIRNFKPFALYKDKIENAFSTEIVKKYDPSSFRYLLDRNRQSELINYRGNYNKFFFLDADEINSKPNLNFIKGKIVLLGFIGTNSDTLSLEDKFFTPLNARYAGKSFPDMYGVVIHANIISMILSRNYINELPSIISFIIAFIIGYLNVILLFYIKVKWDDWFGGLSKLIILIQTILVLFVGIVLFHQFNYRIQLTLLMVVIALVPTSIDFYQNYIAKLPFINKHENIGHKHEKETDN
jgi:CHASE2 domain-containing sensor protein